MEPARLDPSALIQLFPTTGDIKSPNASAKPPSLAPLGHLPMPQWHTRHEGEVDGMGSRNASFNELPANTSLTASMRRELTHAWKSDAYDGSTPKLGPRQVNWTPATVVAHGDVRSSGGSSCLSQPSRATCAAAVASNSSYSLSNNSALRASPSTTPTTPLVAPSRELRQLMSRLTKTCDTIEAVSARLSAVSIPSGHSVETRETHVPEAELTKSFTFVVVWPTASTRALSWGVKGIACLTVAIILWCLSRLRRALLAK